MATEHKPVYTEKEVIIYNHFNVEFKHAGDKEPKNFGDFIAELERVAEDMGYQIVL